MKLEKEYVQLLIEQFQIEFKKKDRSGIYGVTQRMLTYNSNKIEGSTLTEKQTGSLFDTGIIPVEESSVRGKDVEEANGHFAMFNHMLVTLDQPLTQTLIKEFHFKLKNGVFEDMLNGYAVGDYKTRRNIVDNIQTALPNEVESEMTNLLEEYDVMKKHTLKDIALFHVKYETIHPFQDGNGRTGRIIAFRECLKNDLIPFIVKDKNKYLYYTALRDYQSNKEIDALFHFFQQEQKDYLELGFDLVVPYAKKSREERIQNAITLKKELRKKYAKMINDRER